MASGSRGEFVGREVELAQLARFLSRKQASVAVIYGRRRIGKSCLIREALGDAPALHFEGLENRPKKEQIQAFLVQLSHQTGAKAVEQAPRTWREAFLLLEPVLRRQPACVVLDEFQWMANYRVEIVSDLKMVWDQYLSGIPGVSLILCGSIASFMTTKVIRSSALYGRTDTVIHLREFQLHETRSMLPRYGMDELLEAQMVLGGVPKYLELAGEHPSLHLAMDALAFTENGYLATEYDKTFTSHFGRNPEYRSIVEALARHPHGLFRKELAQAAGVEVGGGLSDHLTDLELAGFISSVIPFDKPPTSRLIKYCLSDAYLRFYFAFIRPRLRSTVSGSQRRPFSALTQSGKFQNWRGRAFEHVCTQHARRIAEILGFSGIDYICGPYFRSPRKNVEGLQIDLVFDRADNVMTLCEMKCSRRPVGAAVLTEIAKRAEVLAQEFPTRTIQPVLVLHGEPTPAVVNASLLYAVIQSHELFGEKARAD